MNSKIIYRIEEPNSKSGMWYNEHGILQKRIEILCPYGEAKNFPMPLNLELHRKDGRIWNSGGKSIENMQYWFTALDAKNLLNNDFKLFEIECSLFQELENEILFCREGIVNMREIPLEIIWNINDL